VFEPDTGTATAELNESPMNWNDGLAAAQTFPPLDNPRQAADQLQQCARLLREHLRHLPPVSQDRSPAATWLVEHHSFLQFQIRETRRSLQRSYLRALPRIEAEKATSEFRIYRIAANFAAESSGPIGANSIAQFGETLSKQRSLKLGELWAFAAMLRLVLIERLCTALENESVVSSSIRSLRALELISWCDFVESVSAVENVLRQDPAGVYAQMDFATRDRYRHTLENFARKSHRPEEEVASLAIDCAGKCDASPANHVGYYLIGPGAWEFRKRIGFHPALGDSVVSFLERSPSVVYFAGILLLASLIFIGFKWVAGSFPWWIALLLLVPVSQTAVEMVNILISRLISPRVLPAMDFTDGIPADCKTMVAVPTLLLSAANIAKLLEDLEIRYLANRDPNLHFALLTDFQDAAAPETPNDSVLQLCVDGIHTLNRRYGNELSSPFYLFHRPRQWNQVEQKWMGYERKRGKLNDFNKLLLGHGNYFETVIGEMPVLLAIRYVITLDTDTQLPRDTASKMVATMAHPLNHPVLDPETSTVVEGYALIRPRVTVSMESSGRSRLAQIFSGKPGFDPYATSVSDVYQDLYARASFTGKGIYDLRAFDASVGRRFPENAILSHDLIEGEFARTGLLTGVDLIEDYPATYQAFSKRNHRWARGDWQLLPWLFPRIPEGSPPVPSTSTPVPSRARKEAVQSNSASNPLSFLSRWKILDNLRRSLVEVSLLLLFIAGWLLAPHPARWTLAVILLMQLGVCLDLTLSLIRAPERHLWPAFLRSLGGRFLKSQRDTLLTLVFVPHQACMQADAIVRTLWRRFISNRKLLEWETMAQSEQSTKGQIGMVERYLYVSSLTALVFLFVPPHIGIMMFLVCSLWILAPVAVAWLNESPSLPADLSEGDRVFLRDVALRTWRFFADHTTLESHWLIPDNVQQDPPMVASRTSPTNLGLQLTSQLAAHDLGYCTLGELTRSLQRIFDSMRKMPRHDGHFLNWYDTQTLDPLLPRFVSSVDSGNLAASLCALRQGCLGLLEKPIFEPGLLLGLRDHVLRLREEIPHPRRSLTLMRLLASLLRQLESQPTDLFYWEAVLTDARDIVQRIRETLVTTHARLDQHEEHARSEELRYWESVLWDRIQSTLEELFAIAPWLSPPIEPELRVNMRDASLSPLLAELCTALTLSTLPERYERIRERISERLASPEPLYPALRSALEGLVARLADARAYASSLIGGLENTAADAASFFEEMSFRFLFDPKRKLLRVGYALETNELDDSCYDLLASEARTAVFIAIAKGDIPREAWFRLGRKLTGYRDHRTLISWSGTMFEYLMPILHMKSYGNTLLDRGLRGAIAIQQTYARERDIPWGISEAAHAVRDNLMQYQYRAFGIPSLSASADRTGDVVVAPYASMLALMLAPKQATANLQLLATKGCSARYGFFESLDYSSRDGKRRPQMVQCFMAHHQGMGLLAIDNALFEKRMQERFHLNPLVQATEFLLQERMPELVEVAEQEQVVAA
jgi:cyclic beta-1,2-glucan synthetase